MSNFQSFSVPDQRFACAGKVFYFMGGFEAVRFVTKKNTELQKKHWKKI